MCSTRSDTSLRLHGAARAVTGSANELSFRGEKILVDCGVFQGKPDAAARNRRSPIDDVAGLRAVVLTHAHLDHVGRLPLLVQRGYCGPILGHPATLAIAEIVLRDAARIASYEGSGSFRPGDVDATVAQFAPVFYGARQTVADGVDMTLFDAGHILGSASVLLESRDATVLLSGDLGRRGTPILRDPNTAYPPFARVDHVVIESTYGDREHPSSSAIEDRLRDVLRRALEDGGKVLIPALSVGRTQELIYHLRAIAAEGELAGERAGVPIIVDGPMGLEITALYERFLDAWDAESLALRRAGAGPFSFDGLYGARTPRASELARTIEGPAIIIAGSGMCTGGRILAYLEELLPDERTDVLFVGFQANGTLGRTLVNGARKVVLSGRTIPVRARMTTLPGLSAHADRRELLAWLAAVPGAHSVFVSHGEPEACDAFADAITQSLGIPAVAPAESHPQSLGT